MDDKPIPQSNSFSYHTAGVSSISELVPTQKLQKYIHLFAPTEKIDQSVLSTLSDYGNEFIISVLEEACQIAVLKDSKALEPKDIKFIAENLHDIHLPSTLSVFNNNSEIMDSLTSSITSSISSGALLARDDAHLRRMAHIRQHILNNGVSEDMKNK